MADSSNSNSPLPLNAAARSHSRGMRLRMRFIVLYQEEKTRSSTDTIFSKAANHSDRHVDLLLSRLLLFVRSRIFHNLCEFAQISDNYRMRSAMKPQSFAVNLFNYTRTLALSCIPGHLFREMSDITKNTDKLRRPSSLSSI